MPTKTFVLDTNVILHCADSIFKFEEHTVILPMVVLAELDKFKKDMDEKGRNARYVNRKLDELRNSGSLLRGVTLPSGGTLIVDPQAHTLTGLDMAVNDHQILACAQYHNAILVTKDINLRVKADAVGVSAEDYENDKVDVDEDLYSGLSSIFVEQSAIDEVAKSPAGIGVDFYENQFVQLTNVENPNHTLLTRYIDGKLHKVVRGKPVEGIAPRNREQQLALDLLLDPNIQLVTLVGKAGCVDADTEFFTGEGWKRIADYADGDLVLQYNEDGTASLVSPVYYHKLPAEELTAIKTKYGVDQVLCDDHTVVYETSRGNLGKKRFAEVKIQHEDSLIGFQGRFRTTFKFDGEGVPLTHQELRLMVATIADGSFTTDNTNYCSFNLKKDRKKQRLQEILRAAGYEYKMSEVKPEGYHRIYCYPPLKVKTFPTSWYNCTLAQLKVIADEVLHWDGSFSCGRKRFTSLVKENADFVQFAFSATGHRATLSTVVRTLRGKTYHEYNVHISKNATVGIANRHNKVRMESFKTKDGYKYCFTVPSSMLVLRRGGNIFVTGNCGKTLMALAAGLHQVGGKYKRMLVSRPVVSMGKEIGFLPGDIEEKMAPWMMPIKDNIEQIMRYSDGEDDIEEKKVGRRKSKAPDGPKLSAMDELKAQGLLEVSALTYIRGRSIPKQFMIVDESQNLTPHEIKTIITRAGEGTKIILTGDPFQIDTPYLDVYSNGLSYVVDRFKGQPMYGHVHLVKGERSPLAEMAAELL